MNRTLASVALTTLLLGAMALAHRPDETGVYPELFWRDKIRTAGPYDVVVAGDSRVHRGIAPEVMTQATGCSVLNFGFSGLGYGKDYLDAVGARVRPHGTVVLTLTPSSLTEASAADNGFLDYAKRHESRAAHASLRLAAPVLQAFEPLGYAGLLETLHLRPRLLAYPQDYRPTGWIASDQQPRDPERGVPAYAARFSVAKVSPAVVQTLMDRVRAWSALGLHVIGTRLPIGASLRRVEDTQSGVSFPELQARLVAAGGTWLEPAVDFQTYDGSHMPADEAQRYSAALARRLAGPGCVYDPGAGPTTRQGVP